MYVVISIATIICYLIISTYIFKQIHEKHFLEAYNMGRQHEAEKQELIVNMRSRNFSSEAYEMGRRHAKKD